MYLESTAGEQVVDLGFDHQVSSGWPGARSDERPLRDASMIAATSSAARTTSSFTTTWSNHPCWVISQAAVSSRLAIRSSSSVPAAAQTPLELLHRGRCEEDQDRVRDLPRTCSGALDVDLQDDVAPGRQRLLDEPARRARAVIRRTAPIRGTRLAQHLVELPSEMKKYSGRPARSPAAPGSAPRPSRRRLRAEAEEPLNDAPLADPRRAGEDDQPASARGQPVTS